MCKGNNISHFLLTQKFRYLGDLSMRKTPDVTLVIQVSMVSVYFLQKKKGGGRRVEHKLGQLTDHSNNHRNQILVTIKIFLKIK